MERILTRPMDGRSKAGALTIIEKPVDMSYGDRAPPVQDR
jgi:hypothetical protein